jgi:mono/diheme cytochrome c family protein
LIRARPILIAATLALAGCKATPPGRLERALASQVKRRITVGGRADRNPLLPTEENLRRGQRAFASYCTVCHGLDGRATGVPFAEAMSPPIPSLGSPEVQAYSDGQLRWIIENGIFPSGMPASRGMLGAEEMWGIVIFIRHLPPAGSLGEPPVYSGSFPGGPAPAR